jgi:3'-phosphoadenosine 5'-phosphosulfate sulfotransferase (PAPS reductase)/FAD synthetase
MKLSSRSPLLWTGATILSGLLYFFSFHFFPKTFPLIHLDITMDLKQALERADTIAKENNFGPIEHENAAMFYTDATVKTFVELEAGGKDAFVAMMDEKLYMPYTWRVRHFKEHEKNETTIAFSPDGTPYGFIETISENIPGAQLPEEQARTIAELNAAQQWNIDFNQYSLVEASQKTQSSKRIDHTFVYERLNKTIGEGLYRLKIVVSGDTMSELSHFVKVPEAFNRRYAEMRSANNTIAWAASFIMMLLYLLGGCGFGLYWIIKKRFGIFKQPLKLAQFLAFTSILASINQLPFLWTHYNSAHSSHGFLTQLFLSLVVQLIAQTAFLTIIIATAESLTRKAFGHHPQLWSLWSPKNAASYTVLGRTVGGYLMVGFNCAFVIAFYLFSTRYLGWWMPSETLFDPNVLATYVCSEQFL